VSEPDKPVAEELDASAAEVLDQYLDELLVRLHGDPRTARRLLAEAEDHLLTATRAGVAAGLDPTSAARAARGAEPGGSSTSAVTPWTASPRCPAARACSKPTSSPRDGRQSTSVTPAWQAADPRVSARGFHGRDRLAEARS
jgi:hypothetical protein